MSDANIISIAITLFAIAAGSLFNNVRITDLASATGKRFDDMRDRISDLAAGTNKRFDDMRDLWRAELRRVEEILDARLKHLEERR